MLIEILPENPDHRKIREVVDCLKKGGIIIYPTDSIYSIGCDLFNKRAIEKVAKLKGIRLRNAQFSLICYDLSSLGDYTKQFSRPVYKAMNKALPGPFTFILNASNRIPKLFDSNKKEVGIRIPDNKIAREIVKELGNPIVATSVHNDDEILEYTTDPYEIYEKFSGQVDLVVDGGYGNNEPSTVVDCTNDGIEIVREGIGDIDLLY